MAEAFSAVGRSVCEKATDIITIIIIYPITSRVVGATTNDFATSFPNFPLFSTALWDLPNSRPVHSLVLSSPLFLCLHTLLPPFHCALQDGFGHT